MKDRDMYAALEAGANLHGARLTARQRKLWGAWYASKQPVTDGEAVKAVCTFIGNLIGDFPDWYLIETAHRARKARPVVAWREVSYNPAAPMGTPVVCKPVGTGKARKVRGTLPPVGSVYRRKVPGMRGGMRPADTRSAVAPVIVVIAALLSDYRADALRNKLRAIGDTARPRPDTSWYGEQRGAYYGPVPPAEMRPARAVPRDPACVRGNPFTGDDGSAYDRNAGDGGAVRDCTTTGWRGKPTLTRRELDHAARVAAAPIVRPAPGRSNPAGNGRLPSSRSGKLQPRSVYGACYIPGQDV